MTLIVRDSIIFEYKPFEDVFLSVLEKHVPLKKKTIKTNHTPYMTKILRKAIMRRSFLKNKYYNKNGTDESKSSYKKQRIIVAGYTKKKGKIIMPI